MGLTEGRRKERGHRGRKWAHMGTDSAKDSKNRQLKYAGLLLAQLNIATTVVRAYPRMPVRAVVWECFLV